MKIIRNFFYLLTIPVMSILYAGLILSTLISLLAGILRTIGFKQIKMSVWNGIDLPVAFSIPLSLIVSFFLIICSIYVKRSIHFFVSTLKN